MSTMGGKQKQANRTKGNVKPSSSGRSAALLGNVSLPGFSGMKDSSSLLPGFQTLSLNEDFDPNIDPTFLIVLKKMSKKDSTTRLKALQEFSKLVEDSEIDVIKAALPYWPRLYCTLAGDVEHRVREAAHQAQRTLVVRAKKNVAPYLRPVAGPWFTGQFDTYAPAASAASNGFQDAFPANKLIEAIVFCQEEILKYISDNLLDQTSQQPGTSEQIAEKTEKQERILITCLQGYAHFIRSVPATSLQNDNFIEVSKNMMKSKNFWELINDKNPRGDLVQNGSVATPDTADQVVAITSTLQDAHQMIAVYHRFKNLCKIRSAWLAALTSVLEKAPNLLEDQHQQVVKAVLGRLNDIDPVVLPSIWQATLQIIVTFDDWQEYCNVEKHILPRLWNILREGAYGCAAQVFPCVLPLLASVLPSISDKEKVANTLFTSLRTGIQRGCANSSRSNSEAAARCYMECIRYVTVQEILEANLIEEHVISIVEMMFNETRFAIIAKAIFDEVSSLLLYWLKKSNISANSKMYENFWGHLIRIFTKLMSDMSHIPNFVQPFVLSQQVGLCISLKDCGRDTETPVRKVRFASEENDEKDECEESEKTKMETVSEEESPEFEKYLNNVVEFVNKVCTMYFLQMTERGDLNYISPISELVGKFNSRELYNSLFSRWNMVKLFSDLQEAFLNTSHHYTPLFVYMVIHLSEHMSLEEQNKVFTSISKIPDLFHWMLVRARADENIPHHVLNWLRCGNVNETLVLFCRNLSECNNVLEESVCTAFDKGFIVNVHAISSVLQELHKASDNKEVTLFAATYLSAVKRGLRKAPKESVQCKDMKFVQSTYKWVQTLFPMCCQKSFGSSNYSSNSTALNNAWQDGLRIISMVGMTDIKELVSELSVIMKEKILQRTQRYEEDLKFLVENASKMLKTLSPSTCPVELCSVFLDGFLPQYVVWQQQLKGLCEVLDVLLGAQHCSLKIEKQPTDIEAANYAIISLFAAMLISKVLENSPEEENYEDDPYDMTPEKYERIKRVVGENSFTMRLICGKKKYENPSESEPVFKRPRPTPWTRILAMGKATDVSGGNEGESSCSNLIDEGEAQSFDITHLEEKILQIAMSLSVCEVFEDHLRGTSHYRNMKPHIQELRDQFAVLTKRLEAQGHMQYILNLVLEKARGDGRMWIRTAFLLGQDHCETVFKSVIGDNCFESSVKGLLKTAQLKGLKIPLHFLEGAQPSCTTTALWLNHLEDSSCVGDSTVITEPIERWKKLDHEELLHDCDVTLKDWDEVKSVVRKINFLSVCINKHPCLLNQESWDFIIISAAYYSQNLKQIYHYFFPSRNSENVLCAYSIDSFPLCNVAVFSAAVFDLIDNITRFCQKVERKELQSDAVSFEELTNEWTNVFASDIHLILFDIFTSASEHRDVAPSLLGHLFVDKFSSLTINIGLKTVLQQSEEVQKKIFKASSILIHSSIPSLQMTAYSILKGFVSSLVEADTLAMNDQSSDESESLVFEILPLIEAVQNTQTVVDAMLTDFSFGDSCVVQPHTDTYIYTIAYLLLWDLILNACREASSELRYQYATLLRKLEFLPNLLNSLFCLMPAEVLEEEVPKNKLTAIAGMFSDPPHMNANTSCTCQELQHWACWIYFSVVSRLPALVRQWWSDTKPKVSAVVQRATVQFVTPVLCTRELQAIQNQNTKFPNMEVRVLSKAREVVATYSVDEVHMELTITLPESYPLGSIHVDSHTSLVGTSHWRNWVKQLSIFLTHQNGSLWDGLLLWKSNLDKRFEGVEECYICFSVIHGTNFQIPKLCCKTCKKKFHAPCLYKWFNTSNKSTCPICRNIF